MKPVWFDEDADVNKIGAKARSLLRLSQARLPVPGGFCITVADLAAVVPDEIGRALSRLGTKAVAVRSSAIGEDDAGASYAGIYLTRLNVSGTENVVRALQEIRDSVSNPVAVSYRRRLGIDRPVEMAAVVQEFIPAEVSGVIFMDDPIVVEASWGLGEAVVAGTVNPDRWVLSPEGSVLSAKVSDKDIAIIAGAFGTKSVAVDPLRRRQPCLNAGLLDSIYNVARSCRALFGCPQDIEWAITSNTVWILQCRPITVHHP
jgi:pyruvate,water dikinase